MGGFRQGLGSKERRGGFHRESTFQPQSREERAYAHEADKEINGRRDQQTANLLIITIVADIYSKACAKHSTQLIF